MTTLDMLAKYVTMIISTHIMKYYILTYWIRGLLRINDTIGIKCERRHFATVLYQRVNCKTW